MTANGLPTFSLPQISEGSHFGPPIEDLSLQSNGLSQVSFNKSDRLGMIVDWSITDKQSSGPSAYARRNFLVSASSGNAGNLVDGVASGSGAGLGADDDDDASFSRVDSTKVSAQRRAGANTINRGPQRARGPGGNVGGTGSKWGPGGKFQARNQPRQGAAGNVGGRRQGQGYGGNSWGRRDDRQQRNRVASVTVGNEWNLLEDIDLSRLYKLRLDVETEDTPTISSYGFLYEYDKSFDRINTKNEKPILPVGRLRYNPTASDDPILQEFASTNRAQVFTTDFVISVLMCSVRSVFPWDIVITREGGKLFLDKREDGPFQYLSVNENAGEPPSETSEVAINSQQALSQEATYLNDVFMWQCVREGEESKHSLKSPNPFYSDDETEPLASCGYLYRQFDISASEDETIDMIVRTEVDAISEGQNLSIKTLFEFDPKAPGAGGAPEWRSKLDSQRGSVIATEMKNNSFKLARWAVQSVLAGIGQMKIGFLSRANPRDQQRHTILGTQTFKTKDLTSQMGINLSNGWGIVRAIVDLCMQQEDGKYVLMRDPNKSILRLYQVPADAFGYNEDEENARDEGEDARSEY